MTTARRYSRMGEQVRADLHAKLASLAPLAVDWQHPHVELEIGSGDGAALLHRAQLFPQTLHVGVEVYLNGLHKTLAALAKVPAAHVRLTDHDGRDVLAAVPLNALNALHIYYPDPWRKTKHHKRRLITESFLALALQKIKPTGVLYIATDWADYAADITTLLPTAACASTPFPHWLPTKYEQKARREGRPTWYFTFSKK
jgi:tRNA (guanine-N7-)-methyltransferase